MARLPKVGGDSSTWGAILNEFLMVEHNADGTLKPSGTLANKQPLNADLTAISNIAATTGDIIQYKAGRWTNRTPNQLKGDLAFTKSDVGLENVDNTSDLNKPLSTAMQDALNTKSSGASYVRPYNKKNYSQIFLTNAGWTDFYANGTVGYDTSDYILGASSVKLITPSDSSTPCGMKKMFATAQNWSNKTIKVWVKADDWSNVEAYLIVSTSGSFASSFRFNLAPLMSNPVNYNGKWVELILPQHRAVVQAGTPDWATANGLMLKAYGRNGFSGTVRFNEVAVIENPGRGMISITFDDGHISQFTTAKPILDSHGYKATNFTIPNYIGSAGYMNQEQTDQLALIGWDIAGHYETNLSSLSPEQLQGALKSVRTYLNAHGYKGSDLFAYPNGAESPTIIKAVRQYFSGGRTIVDAAQPINYMDRMRISSRILHNTDTLVAIKGLVDAAIANNEWLVLCFHKIVAAPTTSIEWSTADFASLIDYISTKDVPVLPMSDALTLAEGLSQVATGSTTPPAQSPVSRWLRPYHTGVAASDVAPVSGRVMLYQMEVSRPCTIDALVFVNGSVASGNVTVGIYGPVSLTTDTCAGASLVAQSASTAVTAVNMPQTIPLTTPAAITAGKYYLAIAHDNTTDRYLRVANQMQVTGWLQYFDQTYSSLPATCPAVVESGANGHGVTARCSA